MKSATLFPDDDIHDSADDWKGSSVSSEDRSTRRPPPRKSESTPAVHGRKFGNDGTASNVGAVPYDNGTLTSRKAAESIRPCVNSQAARVFGFIDSQGERGATDKEVQAGLQMDGNSQRPRRVWLMRNGFVKPKGAPCEHVVRERSIVWVVAKRLELDSSASSAAESGDSAGSQAEGMAENSEPRQGSNTD